MLLAEAAVGLGGMSVNKYRTKADRARTKSLLHGAIEQLPVGADVLRARLRTRLTAEEAFENATLDGMLEALDDARRTGDQLALAEALSLTHHAMFSPQYGEQRLAVAEELIVVAAAAGLDTLTLVGICRRTIDLFHLGDPRAERSLTELGRRASALESRSVLYIHSAMEVMLLVRAGRLDEAADQAAVCYQRGAELGDADALAYYHAQLFSIRWLQGRGSELADLAEQMANSPTMPDLNFTFNATSALLAAEAGAHDRARSALQRITSIGLENIPYISTWLAFMFAVVHAAALLQEETVARQAYDLLLPYAHLPMVPSVGVTCLGSTELPLGMAALTFGDMDTAIDHLTRAVTANVRLGHRPLTAYARADLAEALLRRNNHGDRPRANELLDSAIAEANAMGMTNRMGRCLKPQTISLGHRDNHWVVGYGDRETTVDDLVGVRYLARLVANPGTEISALDLVSGGPDSANQPLIDDTARAAYTARAHVLVAEITEARDNADHARVARLEVELDALTAEIERSTGRAGRSRAFTGSAERARIAVRKAITRAIDAVEAREPAAAMALRSTVTTGYQCSYRPTATPV
nr:hypothetical protein [Kibdelosporangium sp. MJ126-NF4]